MTVGTQDDILARIKALLPYRWFPDSTPVLDALLSGIAWGLALVYSLIAHASVRKHASRRQRVTGFSTL